MSEFLHLKNIPTLVTSDDKEEYLPDLELATGVELQILMLKNRTGAMQKGVVIATLLAMFASQIVAKPKELRDAMFSDVRKYLDNLEAAVNKQREGDD